MAAPASAAPRIGSEAFDECTAAVIEFLQSKCLFAAERALRTELELEQQRGDSQHLLSRNLFTSKLEVALGAQVARRPMQEPASEILDMTPLPEAVASTLDPNESDLAAGACASALSDRSGKGRHEKRPRLHLFDVVACGADETSRLRRQRGQEQGPTRVVFRDGRPLTQEQEQELAHVSLPMLYNPHVNGLEDSSELPISVGVVIAQRYRVVALIGKGSFSRVVQCLDLYDKKMVSVKVLKNDKDCVDQGLGEVRLLALIARSLEGRDGGEPANVQLLRLLDYFYFKEHLFIVTELLRDSLFNFYRYLNSQAVQTGHASPSAPVSELGCRAYFSSGTLATLADQLLEGLAFLHSLNITHCDLKPENVCIVSASRRQFKIIDFGSAVMHSDCHNSYVQSRWYRAPEVMLGLPWDGKVDVWGVGCILAELLVGQPIFYGSSVEMVLAAQASVLGPPPPHMLRASELAPSYYKQDGTVYSVEPGGERRAGLMRPRHGVDLGSLCKIDEPGLLSFLSALLTTDPEQRPTAQEALNHPWLLHAAAASEPSMDGAPSRHKLLSSQLGYMSPCSSRAGSGSCAGSPSSSQTASRDSSPLRPVMRVGPDGQPASPTLPASRGGSGTCSGPGVPQEFREAASAEASHSHEWRERLVRYANTANSRGGGGDGGVPPSPVSPEGTTQWPPGQGPTFVAGARQDGTSGGSRDGGGRKANPPSISSRHKMTL